MQYIYTALFKPIEDGSGYYAKVPDLPGCITTGKNLPDAINQITDAMSAWLVVAEDEGEPIAAPTQQEQMHIDPGTTCSLIFADTIVVLIAHRFFRIHYGLSWKIRLLQKFINVPLKYPVIYKVAGYFSVYIKY